MKPFIVCKKKGELVPYVPVALEEARHNEVFFGRVAFSRDILFS